MDNTEKRIMREAAEKAIKRLAKRLSGIGIGVLPDGVGEEYPDNLAKDIFDKERRDEGEEWKN